MTKNLKNIDYFISIYTKKNFKISTVFDLNQN